MAERKLATILAADAVGYSRLMAADEEGTALGLRAAREVIDGLITSHYGRIFHTAGDSVVAEFASPVEAVRCAVEIQGTLKTRSSDVAEPHQMRFRIGVNLGDVMIDGDNLLGDGVNIAARLESIAEPGGVCISGSVHEQVHNKLDASYDDLGPQNVKNMPDAVRVYRVRIDGVNRREAPRPGRRRLQMPTALFATLLLVVIGAGVWLTWPASLRLLSDFTGLRIPPADAPLRDARKAATDTRREDLTGFGARPAIAVLPFDNLSGDPQQEYFADGIAEDLITRLSTWRSFPVIARNSTFVYKGQAVDLRQIGSDLDARYVVEGSVRREGVRVRITAQLIDASTGQHVWAETYDRDVVDVFAVQDEISSTIAASVVGDLHKVESERALRQEPRNLDAWDLLQRGSWHFDRMTREENIRARNLFERAVEVDPYFAAAFARLAGTHYFDIVSQWSPAPERSLEELFTAARRSVALDPRGSEGQAMLAAAYSVTGQGAEMKAAAERAIELNPSSPFGYIWLAYALTGSAGTAEESLAVIDQAIRLSPHDPLAWTYYDLHAAAYIALARYEQAIAPSQKVIQMRPDYSWAYLNLAICHAYLGHADEAQTALAEGLRLQPNLSVQAIRQGLSFADEEIIEHYVAGLQKAGWQQGG